MSAPKPPASPNAEWMDTRQAVAHFGLCETRLYQLSKAGKIKSVLDRQPGKLTGKRLFVTASIREYLTSLVQ